VSLKTAYNVNEIVTLQVLHAINVAQQSLIASTDVDNIITNIIYKKSQNLLFI